MRDSILERIQASKNLVKTCSTPLPMHFFLRRHLDLFPLPLQSLHGLSVLCARLCQLLSIGCLPDVPFLHDGTTGLLRPRPFPGARSVQCESKYILQSSGGAIRRALFRVERGVCVRCRADCRALVLRLRAVEKGSRDWEARRRALIAEYAPRCVIKADCRPSLRTCTAQPPLPICTVNSLARKFGLKPAVNTSADSLCPSIYSILKRMGPAQTACETTEAWVTLSASQGYAMRCHGWLACMHGSVASEPAVASPRFMERGYKAAQERLVKTAVEGHAWQADHIVPVYRGGGRCGLENLRTLCTPCHADVTKQQAKDRAAMR